MGSQDQALPSSSSRWGRNKGWHERGELREREKLYKGWWCVWDCACVCAELYIHQSYSLYSLSLSLSVMKNCIHNALSKVLSGCKCNVYSYCFQCENILCIHALCRMRMYPFTDRCMNIWAVTMRFLQTTATKEYREYVSVLLSTSCILLYPTYTFPFPFPFKLTLSSVPKKVSARDV